MSVRPPESIRDTEIPPESNAERRVRDSQTGLHRVSITNHFNSFLDFINASEELKWRARLSFGEMWVARENISAPISTLTRADIRVLLTQTPDKADAFWQEMLSDKETLHLTHVMDLSVESPLLIVYPLPEKGPGQDPNPILSAKPPDIMKIDEGFYYGKGVILVEEANKVRNLSLPKRVKKKC